MRSSTSQGVRIACLIAAFAFVLGCGGGGDAGRGEGGSPAGANAEQAPAFTLPDLDGEMVSLSDFDGKVRIIDFWATWCAPCREEVPMYKEIHEEYSDRGVVLLAISQDFDEPQLVRDFVEEFDIPYVTLMADEQVSQDYAVMGLPQAFVVDRDGRIVKRFLTGAKPKSAIVEVIEPLLAVEAPSERAEPGPGDSPDSPASSGAAS